MDTLEIKKEAALKAHEAAKNSGKELLENLFGKKTFQKDVTERIKSIDDAVEELGENDVEVIELRKLQKAGITSHILKNQMAVVIVKALNEDWAPDWSNSSQYKYFPWFKMGSSSGVGFSCDGCDYWYAGSAVGSRLVSETREKANAIGNSEEYQELFKTMMVYNRPVEKE